jgi:[acyl-carrier-protein] S-malonyltransferase
MHFAFLFPGQGSQYPGMVIQLLQEFPYIKEYFIEASQVLDYDILDLCINGPEDKLNLTAKAQPAILVLSYSAFQILLKETEIKPFLLAGHSLGEISALCCSGAIKFPDAVKIVKKRGELMQQAVSAGNGSMLALNGLTLDEVQELCNSDASGKKAVVSNINSTNQIVISGLKENIEAAGNLAKQKGAIVIPLNVSAPFHSPMMESVSSGFETELNYYSFSRLEYPVISNVICKPYMDENEIIPLLTEQITVPVNWLKIMEYISKTPVNITLELPPKKTLTRFFKYFDNSGISSYSFEQINEVLKLFKSNIVTKD